MIDNKIIYEQTDGNGCPVGSLSAKDIPRFHDTWTHILSESTSLLDVGCFSGEWLAYVMQKSPSIKDHLGIDVASNKIETGKQRHPNLNLKCAYAEDMISASHIYDTVTCLEVLEHIPDWEAVFKSLFVLAQKQVLITVPYREIIQQTVCIHCAQTTPMYGHLRSYTEQDFPDLPGWKRQAFWLPDKRGHLLIRLYRRFKRKKGWLLLNYRRES